MNNLDTNPEDEVLAQSIKTAGQAYFLSEARARQIVSQLKAPTLSPLSSHLKRRDQGRSIISNFMTHINVFMSTTAKAGLIVLVLGLIGVFGYTQLGSKSTDYTASSEDAAPASNDTVSGSSDTDVQSAQVAEKASGNVDDTVSAILASASGEGLVLGEEEADAALIANDSQELLDLTQAINDNDF